MMPSSIQGPLGVRGDEVTVRPGIAMCLPPAAFGH